MKEFPDIDRKLSIKVYSFPSNLSWPHRLHLLRSSWGFDQTTEIRFGSPKFDCSLVSNEHLGDGCMDLLAERMEWFQNQDHQHPLDPRSDHVFTLSWRSLCPALCLPIALQHPPQYKPILFSVIGEFLVERTGKSQDLVGCCSAIYSAGHKLLQGRVNT